ncbi:MAG: acyl carrier protein [Chloroflexi bacterium]|nr:acyl carrier protein [Chloroflexota bacterium]
MTTEIINGLTTFITTQIIKRPDKELALDTPLISGGLIDSFSLVDLALFIEDTFGVQVDDTELNAETFDTLSELVNLIKSRQS